MYGQTFTLKIPLPAVECWNRSDGSTGSFQAGETVLVLGPYDTTRTTIRCAEEDGRPLVRRDGAADPHPGYRFIVPNALLGRAIDADVPEQTEDLIGALIAYEEGEATPAQEQALLESLRESGLGAKLQGRYGRCL